MIVAPGEIMGWEAPTKLRGVAVNDPIHTHITGAMNRQPLKLGFKMSVDMMEYAVEHTPMRPRSPLNRE